MNKNNRKIPGPENRLFWLCILLVLKLSLLYFLVSENRPTLLPDTIAICSGDCESYIEPIDAFIDHGRYEPDYRMPGYNFFYFLARLIADKNQAVNILIVFQTVIDALAALLLAITLLNITGKKLSFYITIFLYGFGVSVSCYNNWIMTESLTSSTFIFAFYFLSQFIRTQKNYFLLLSGLFLTGAYFMRPINFILVGITAIFIFIYIVKEKRIQRVLLFILPALVLNSIWSARNYFDKGKLYLLTENVYVRDWYGNDGIACMEFCKTFSDLKITYCYFERRGLTYFGQAMQRYDISDIKIPEEIYTPDFNEDSLLNIRFLFDTKYAPGTSPEKAAEIEQIITDKFKRYTVSIKKHHPYIVNVKTPILLTKSFILQSGVHNLFYRPFSYLPIYRKAIKLFFIGIYVTAFGAFLAGLLFYKKVFDNKMILLAYVIAFYLIFIHSIVLRTIEPRYIIPAYPFFVIAAAFTISGVMNFLNKKRIND